MEEVDAEPEDELWTLIRHRKGELRAPGRCERDMCPREESPTRGIYSAHTQQSAHLSYKVVV